MAMAARSRMAKGTVLNCESDVRGSTLMAEAIEIVKLCFSSVEAPGSDGQPDRQKR